ncbi:MAG: FAD-binding oxidoreductase [Verrucomicrobiales bacterium]
MVRLLENLRELLGTSKVSAEAADIDAHSSDKWFASHPPTVVVFAESTADVAATLRYAHEHEIAVTPRGAGVGYAGGCVPVHGGIALSVARMRRIREINTADGIAIVEPGVITGELQQAVKAQGWFYPPDPASLGECSIGGNIATNAAGPRSLKYGVTRHYILGLEAVLAGGEIVRAGGRTHKNKTGFDLIGLFAGSEGMLGIVTEATLRLIPHPPARAMLSATFASFARAAEAAQGVLGAGFLPAALEISDRFTLEAARKRLGASALPPGDSMLLVEIDGQVESVRHELGILEKLLHAAGAMSTNRATTEAACEQFWSQRREFSYSLRDTGLTKLNEDVVVPRGRLVELVNFCETLQAETALPIACFGHAGDGNIHVNVMVAGIDEAPRRALADLALDRLFHFVLSIGGAITGEHGVGIAKMPWFAQAIGPQALELHRRLKAALDPKGILNPGKFL